MKNMSYTVTEGYNEKVFTIERIAKAQAKKWAKESKNDVYISFFRKSDGQMGYINPDGAGLTGKSWSK